MTPAEPETVGRAELALADIADLRAYEREREAFRAQVMPLKKRRRVHLGTIVTLVFENRDTIRFQIQEMARVEKLTSDEQLREWLPRLVGIERSLVLRAGLGDDATVVRAVPEESHDAQLTREDVTASVHYVRWELTPEEVDAVASGPVWLAVDHPDYQEEAELLPATVAELLADLRG